MTSDEIECACALAAMMGQQSGGTTWISPNTIGGTVHKLVRLSKRHHKLCERLCNESDDSGAIERALRVVQTSIVAEYASCFRADNQPRVTFQRDPRGITVRFCPPGDPVRWYGVR